MIDTFTWIKRLRAAPLTRAEHHIALTLATYMDWETGTNARPSNRTLAKECHMDVKSVRKALTGLELKGWIQIQTEGSGRRPATWKTSIPDDIWKTIAGSQDMEASGVPPHPTTAVGVPNDTPLDTYPQPAEGPQTVVGGTYTPVEPVVVRETTLVGGTYTPNQRPIGLSPNVDTTPRSARETAIEEDDSPPAQNPEPTHNPDYHPDDWQRALAIARDNEARNPTAYARTLLRNGLPPREHPGPGWIPFDD